MAIFTCKYCDFKTVKEEKHTAHNCKVMQKMRIMEMQIGKNAFRYYLFWRNLNSYKTVDRNGFMNSRYFTCFITFVEYANKMHLPDVLDYIKYVTTAAILPQHWYNDNIYDEYIKFYDKTKTPYDHVEVSIKTLSALSRIFECEISTVFDHIRPGEMFKLLQARKLSPWLLLLSPKFKDFLLFKVSKEQNIIIQNIINPTVWRLKFNENLEDVKKIKKYVTDFKL